MNKEKKFYLTVTAFFILVVLATLSIEVAAFSYLSQFQANLKEKEYYAEKLTEKENILIELKARYEKIESYLPLIDNTLPAEKDLSKTLSDINTIAEEAGLKLVSLEPKSEQTSSKKAIASTDLSLLQTKKGRYGYEMPLEIRVRGSYSRYVNFIKKIENYQRLLSIENMTIEKQESETVADYIEARIYLIAYLKK